MSYIEANLLLSGALSEEHEFATEEEFELWMAGVRAEAAEDDWEEAEIFRIDHPHEPGIECECVQYLTDHHPVWSVP